MSCNKKKNISFCAQIFFFFFFKLKSVVSALDGTGNDEKQWRERKRQEMSLDKRRGEINHFHGFHYNKCLLSHYLA